MIVHDAEAEDLVELGQAGNVTLRVNPALVETDVVVTVTAAETVLHGGPAALLAASGRESLRAAGALSLLETSASQGWRLAVAIERLLGERVPVIGVSLTLNAPRVAGPFAGYPYDQEAIERMLRSRVRRVFQLAPGRMRQRVLERLPARADRRGRLRRNTVGRAHRGAAARHRLQGSPARRAARCDRDRDPADDTVHAARAAEPGQRRLPRPRARAAPLAQRTAARPRRHRDPRPPVRAPVRAPTQTPYRSLFYDARTAGDIGAMRDAEAVAVNDTRAIAEYRAGRACHPLQPFLEWSACDATAHRLGAVLIAGCRDAQSARQLGYVPAHGLPAALEMARGRGAQRIGYLLAPPYFPLVVGSSLRWK